MSTYDFSVLDDFEFELLCKDLFNEEQRLLKKSDNGLPGGKIISFKTFKRGKDSGIDLYYEDDIHTVIGQVKLSRGKFQDLYSTLLKKVNGKSEADKVRESHPSKYVFMTSTPLSLANKNKLYELFQPYIISINDIYGREDINDLISKFENIERRHLKLYLNNPLVLDRLMNSATFSRSSLSLTDFQSNLRYFVQTEGYLKSLEILQKERLLILKGLPGVGKTTLAKMLSLSLVESGFTFVEIYDLDNELERVIDKEEKLVLYFDDFLGSNSFSVAEGLRQESRLSSLLRRIILSRDKYLILTTRTNVLSNARLKSEKLRSVFDTVTKYEVDLSELNLAEKKQILLNHFKKNDLDMQRFLPYVTEIIQSSNFNPRLVEFICFNLSVDETLDLSFIRSALDKPEEIWNFAYHHQTDSKSKIYLNHLFMFGNSCNAKKFEKSFRKRIDFEKSKGIDNITGSEFRDCTALMDSFFIKVDSITYGHTEPEIEFINPSFIDYLFQEIKSNNDLIKGSVKSFDCLEIVTVRFDHQKQELLNLISRDELRILILNSQFIGQLENDLDKMEYLTICAYYFPVKEISKFFLPEITTLIKKRIDENLIDSYFNFANCYYKLPAVNNYFKLNFNNIISESLSLTKYKDTFDGTIQLFDKFDIDLSLFVKNDKIEKLFYSTLKNVLNEEIDNAIIFRNDRLKNINDVDYFYIELKNEYKDYLKNLFAPEDFIESILDSKDWESIINYYNFKNSGY